MPNWCNNSVEIHGPIEKIKAMYNDAVQDTQDDNKGLLNHLCPMPAELEGTTAPSEDGMDWYNWRVDAWGTKWEVSSEGLEFYDNRDGTGSITGWFDSAWAPPLGAFEHYIAENDDVSITCYYEEPGMDFAGKWVDGDDQYCDDIHGKVVHYIKHNEMPDDDLFKELDEYFEFVENRREWIEEDLAQEEA